MDMRETTVRSVKVYCVLKHGVMPSMKMLSIQFGLLQRNHSETLKVDDQVASQDRRVL